MKYARVPLKAVVSYNDEVLPDSTSEDQLIRYIEIGDVREAEGIRGAAETTFGEAPSRARRIVREGDVIVSTVRTYLRAVAPVTARDAGSIASTGFAVLRARRIEPRFLRYAVLNREFLDEVVARSVGISYPAINPSDLVRVEIPLPPEEEQRAIADYLDGETAQIDAFIAKNEHLVALLAERRASTIDQALDVHTYARVRLKRRLAANDGGVWGDEPTGDGDTIVLRSTEQTADGFWRINRPAKRSLTAADRIRFRLKVGDVLVTKSSGSDAHIGKATIVDSAVAQLDAAYSNFMQRLTPARLLRSRFLWYSLRSRAVRDQINLAATSTTGLGNLTGQILGDLLVACPDVEQQDVVVAQLDATLSKVDAAVDAARRAIDLARERRAALISAAVTGKIDVGMAA